MESLGLTRQIVQACEKLQICTPTEIQIQVIPKILGGGQPGIIAKTGSGKTAAYVLPVLQTWQADPYGVYCLTLLPTRELAVQVAEQFTSLGYSINFTVCLAIGGVSKLGQVQEILKRPGAVVATIGRLVDLFGLGGIVAGTDIDYTSGDEDLLRCFKRLKVLVLDEGDRLLSKNFSSDLPVLLKRLRANSKEHMQTLLVGATLTHSMQTFHRHIKDFANPKVTMLTLDNGILKSIENTTNDTTGTDTTNDTTGTDTTNDTTGTDTTTHTTGTDTTTDTTGTDIVNLNPEEQPPDPRVLTQRYVFLPSYVKLGYLIHLLKTVCNVPVKTGTEKIEIKGKNESEGGASSSVAAEGSCTAAQGMIFTATCEMCQEITTVLQLLKCSATGLHSLQTQKHRFASLAKLRSLKSTWLVATDVASRGLDLPKVQYVLHYDFPRTYEDYLHRVGRTARMRRLGASIAFITERDVPYVKVVEQRMGRRLEEQSVDDDAAILEIQAVAKVVLKAHQLMHTSGFQNLVKARTERRRSRRQSLIASNNSNKKLKR